MEPKFRTSFIPKRALEASSSVVKKAGDPLGAITLVALVIALGSITLAVGAFLYQQLLTSSIGGKVASLERARAAFEPALIEELVRLDSRTESARVILGKHLMTSAVFDALEENTLGSVQFQEFNMTQLAPDKLSITLKGVARDFRGVALQADLFGKSKIIRDPIFSNLNLNQSGNAVFNVSALVDTSLINFGKQAARESIAPQNNQ